MDVFDYMGSWGHEQLVMCTDPEVGLKAVIAIHDTTLGPACGSGHMNRSKRRSKTPFGFPGP